MAAVFYSVLGGAIVVGIAVNAEQYPIRTYFIDAYSCARNILRYPRVEVYTIDSLKVHLWRVFQFLQSLLITSAVVLSVLVILIFFCLSMIARVLRTDCVHISATMLKAHKKFVGLLYIQVRLSVNWNHCSAGSAHLALHPPRRHHRHNHRQVYLLRFP